MFIEYYSHQRLCDYEYVQLCRKFSTEVKLVLSNKGRVTAVCDRPKTTTYCKDVHMDQKVVSQKEMNNLLGSFYTTERRFRNITAAKDVMVYIYINICYDAYSVILFAEFF